MDVFVDAFWDPDGGDPYTREINDIDLGSPQLYKLMYQMLSEVADAYGYDVEYFELWDKNAEGEEPVASYDPQEVIKTYRGGIERLKSIWTYRR